VLASLTIITYGCHLRSLNINSTGHLLSLTVDFTKKDACADVMEELGPFAYAWGACRSNAVGPNDAAAKRSSTKFCLKCCSKPILSIKPCDILSIARHNYYEPSTLTKRRHAFTSNTIWPKNISPTKFWSTKFYKRLFAPYITVSARYQSAKCRPAKCLLTKRRGADKTV